jgi:hypothetical protein
MLLSLLFDLERLLLLFIICKKCRNGVKTHYNVSRSKEAGWFQHSGNNSNCQHRILDLFVLSFFMLELVSSFSFTPKDNVSIFMVNLYAL